MQDRQTPAHCPSISSKVGTTTTYGVNGLNERVSKTAGTSTWVYVYAAPGHLLGVYNGSTGAAMEELAYLGERPVATARAGTVYPIETDHLMAPLRALDSSNAVVWSWEDREPFGATAPTEGTVGGQPFSLGLRFPGQWADRESGLVSNGFRDYDPSLGRYVEVDPLGLAAGMNPYSYVKNTPLNSSDPFGLASLTFGGYFGPGLEVTVGSDDGNRFLTVRFGIGLGAGVAYDPDGEIPGAAPEQRCRGGVVLAASFQGHLHAGPMGTDVELGAARNYSNQESTIYSGPSTSVVNGKWKLGASASIGGQLTEYIPRPVENQ